MDWRRSEVVGGGELREGDVVGFVKKMAKTVLPSDAALLNIV
jgi:hypothetical protein